MVSSLKENMSEPKLSPRGRAGGSLMKIIIKKKLVKEIDNEAINIS